MSIRVTYANAKLRGFHKHLLAAPPEGVDYFFPKESEPRYIEVKPNYLNIPTKILHSRLADYLGIIFAERVQNEVSPDVVVSYNRYVNTERPYIIYLENPTALFHYEPVRSRTYLGKKRLKKLSNNSALKQIVCMSESCLKTVRLINPYLRNSINISRIYPYIPNNPFVNIAIIKSRSSYKKLKCLLVSSDFILKGGREIIHAMNSQALKNKVELTIVTNKSSIPIEYLNIIKKSSHIRVIDFSLPYDKLSQLYGESNILLHPTLKDSFGLVILEAIKAGLVVIATNLYAISEMVKNNVNGYLTEPPLYYFTPDGLPNEHIWNNQSLLVNDVYPELISFIISSLNELSENREKLMEMSIRSLEISNNENFGCDAIKNSWKTVYSQCLS